MKTLLVLLSTLLTFGNAQEFVQRPIKILYEYPNNDGPFKFDLKYISPTKLPPQDSIWEEQYNNYNEKNNNYHDRVSIFFWQPKANPRVMTFFSSVWNLYTDPFFYYDVMEKTPVQKENFYMTEDLFEQGIQMIYCQGVKQDTIKDSVSVMVALFKTEGRIHDKFNFNWHQMVKKNTTFKIQSGKSGVNNYLKIGMYQEGIFVKWVYDWNSSGLPPKPFLTTTGFKKLDKRIKIETPRLYKFDLLGRIGKCN